MLLAHYLPSKFTRDHSLFLILGLMTIFWVSSVQGISNVIISEFMAENNLTLADEDGDYSDWIELYNPGTNTVNLQGWFLANKATNPTQWMFPSTNLGPNSFLVVFASGKDRRVPGSPLHASFKLSASGEYLALVLPDGVTRASEFSPAFPQQYPDISYGNAMIGAETVLVGATSPARALIPTSDMGFSWSQSRFDDSGWMSGTLGAGYDTSGGYSPSIGLDLEGAMLHVNSSAYLRVPFAVTDPTAFKRLSLSMRYNDGFVAYLNGTEVLRRNAPVTPLWNSFATAVHAAPDPGALIEDFEGTSPNYALHQYGSNPGASVQSAGAGSSGRFLRLLSEGTNGQANAVSFRQTASGLFETVVADFDFRMASLAGNPGDGFAFMLIPTALYGTNGPGVNMIAQNVEVPNYKGVLGVGFRVYPHTSVNNVSVSWDATQQIDTAISTSTLDLASAMFHHAQVTLRCVGDGALVSVGLTRDVNGTPGAPFWPITNLFIVELSPFDCRIQFAGRSQNSSMALDLDNCNAQFRPPQGPLGFEEFDLSKCVNLLTTGTNLLAIQGLNVSAGDSNFLIQPQLVGRDFVITKPATYLYPPTAGTWNETVKSLIAPPPVAFYPSAGVYASNTVSVSLSSDSSAMIRYTLDGTIPGTNSRVYTKPILISTNATFRARSELQGVLGEIIAANYVLLDPSVINFSSNLPLIIIDTVGQTIPNVGKIGSYSWFIGTNTTTGRSSLRGSANYAGRLGIGLHGSSSLQFPKQPYSIEVDDESDNSVDYALLGMPAGSDWLLYPSYDDKTFLNNVLTEEMFESMGHYAVRRQYTELFLHSGSGKVSYRDYQGIYILIERIRVASNRVNITKMDATDDQAPAVTGGYLFSRDKINAGDLTFTTSSGQQLIALYPEPDKITQIQLNYLIDYLDAFEGALYGGNWRDPIRGYRNYIDVDSFVDYHWIVEYPKNIDGIRISDYMNKDRNGKIKMEPIWDWDLSWGNANYGDGGHTNNWYYSQLGDYDDIWLSKLRSDPDFNQKIIDRWGALRLKVFNPTNLFSRVDQITNYLWEAQTRDFARWPRLGTYVWPNPNGAMGGWDVDYVTPTTYSGIIAQFKNFVLGRYLWIDQQFVPAPILTSNASTFSLNTALGSIYYTLDGTDPRASGGGLSSKARPYSGSVTLTNNAQIFARSFYTNSWSAPAEDLYIGALPALRITEINYHPGPPPKDSPFTDRDLEFIEVQNTGTNVIDLAGARLSGGVNFPFEPNQWIGSGTATSNNFDASGTPFSASTLGSRPGPYLTNDGPNGTLLCLLNSSTNSTHNRVAFNETASGDYDRLTADFDFRAASALSATANGTPTRQDFDSSIANYSLAYNGSTAPIVLAGDPNSTGNYLRLVPSSGVQLGVVAFDRSATGAFDSVVASFDFRITPPPGATPADGLGFALLNTAAYGINGSGLSFSEEPNLTSSIGVGFDVYNNASSPAEPNNNHVSLHWNGSQVGNAATPSFSMANGKFHHAQIIVHFSGNNAYVTVRLTPDIHGTPGPTETVMEDALIVGAAAYESRAAFGARTGGAWAAHDLDNVDVQFARGLAQAAGLSLVILPVSQFGATGVGSTLANYTDLPLVANTLALDLSFNPSALFNDVSVYWNRALVSSFPVPAAEVNLSSGIFHHAHIVFDALDGGVYATVSLVPNSLATPQASINVFSNWFIPGASLGASRIEFAARNDGLLTKMDLENPVAQAEILSPLLLNPGESIVVVHNLAAFRSRYGAGVRVAGEFSGSLDNAGEGLVLLGPLGEPILNFNYDPSWYPSTDGGGYSLVTTAPNASTGAWGLPSNWRPSSELGGSPGVADPLPALPALTITLPPSGDLVELAWSATVGDYALVVASTPAGSPQWLSLTNSPVLSNGYWKVTLPFVKSTRFYRLSKR